MAFVLPEKVNVVEGCFCNLPNQQAK